MRIRFLDAGGFQTRILHEGSGRPVLMLHGLGTTGERWVRNIDSLAADFSVVAPDLLGAGFTANPEFGPAPQLQHVAHLRALIDQVCPGDLAIIGSSYGGLLAALLALELPERVRRLVIVGSGSAFHSPDEQAKVIQAARANALRALEDGTLDGTRQRMERIVFDPASVPPTVLLTQLTANALPGRRKASEQWYDGTLSSLANAEAQVFHRLEAIRVPTLIITGRDDIRASVPRAQEAARRIPNCRLEIFDKCGHGPMVEHPGAFNERVREFLAGDWRA
jgi:pimeloyl-ACP methyl ester carboxylesterase